jgi:hypothetical protein
LERRCMGIYIHMRLCCPIPAEALVNFGLHPAVLPAFPRKCCTIFADSTFTASTTSCTTTRVGTMRSISSWSQRRAQRHQAKATSTIRWTTPPSRSQRRVQRDQAKATSTIRRTTPPSRSQRRPLRLHVQQCRLPGEHQLTSGLQCQ